MKRFYNFDAFWMLERACTKIEEASINLDGAGQSRVNSKMKIFKGVFFDSGNATIWPTNRWRRTPMQFNLLLIFFNFKLLSNIWNKRLRKSFIRYFSMKELKSQQIFVYLYIWLSFFPRFIIGPTMDSRRGRNKDFASTKQYIHAFCSLRS